jgi:hypothetical protein
MRASNTRAPSTLNKSNIIPYQQSLNALLAINPTSDKYKRNFEAFGRLAPRFHKVKREEYTDPEYFSLVKFDLLNAYFTDDSDKLEKILMQFPQPSRLSDELLDYSNHYGNSLLMIATCLNKYSVFLLMLTYLNPVVENIKALTFNHKHGLNIYHLGAQFGAVKILDALLERQFKLHYLIKKSRCHLTVLDYAVWQSKSKPWIQRLHDTNPIPFYTALINSSADTQKKCARILLDSRNQRTQWFFTTKALETRPKSILDQHRDLSILNHFCAKKLPKDLTIPEGKDYPSINDCNSVYDGLRKHQDNLHHTPSAYTQMHACIEDSCHFNSIAGHLVAEQFIHDTAKHINRVYQAQKNATLIFLGSGWLGREYLLLSLLTLKLDALAIHCIDPHYFHTDSSRPNKTGFVWSSISDIQQSFRTHTRRLNHANDLNIVFHKSYIEFEDIATTSQTTLVSFDFDLSATKSLSNMDLSTTLRNFYQCLIKQNQTLYAFLLIQFFDRQPTSLYKDDNSPLIAKQIRQFRGKSQLSMLSLFASEPLEEHNQKTEEYQQSCSNISQ